jgi:hypothetical protein
LRISGHVAIFSSQIGGEVYLPTIRSLASDIAVLLGRPSNEGWVFTERFQELGLFPKGRGGRGGSGAPDATTAQATLLLLAMACGRLGKAAVECAFQIAAMPPCAAMVYCRDSNGVVIPQPANWPFSDAPPYGVALGSIIDSARAGLWSSPEQCDVAHILVSSGPVLFAELRGHEMPRPDGMVGWFLVSYADHFGAAALAFPHAGSVVRIMPVSLLAEIARLLGPLTSDGGGGEDIAQDEDDAGELEVAAPLAASAGCDYPSKEIH